MKDILPQIETWQRQGKRFALATLVAVERSAPHAPGACMAVCEDGRLAGSVSGGCVESALHEEAMAVLAGGPPKLVSYGIGDDEGFAIGLSCGGTIHVFVDHPELPGDLLDALRLDLHGAVATGISGPMIGKRLTLLQGRRIGSLGSSDLDRAIAKDAEELRARRANARRSYTQGDVFIETFGPPPAMYIFGAVEFGAALARMGKFLGYRVTVCDPREVFASPERFPAADEVVVSWPDAFLRTAAIDGGTAICVLSHDPKLDVPALKQALASEAGYIGAMGARRTHEARLQRLREEGCNEQQLARIHAPIGLDLGGRGPEETAVAIAAELITIRNRATTALPAA